MGERAGAATGGPGQDGSGGVDRARVDHALLGLARILYDIAGTAQARVGTADPPPLDGQHIPEGDMGRGRDAEVI